MARQILLVQPGIFGRLRGFVHGNHVRSMGCASIRETVRTVFRTEFPPKRPRPAGSFFRACGRFLLHGGGFGSHGFPRLAPG